MLATGIHQTKGSLLSTPPSPAVWGVDIFAVSSKGFALPDRALLTRVQSDLLRLALKARVQELEAGMRGCPPCWSNSITYHSMARGKSWHGKKSTCKHNAARLTYLDWKQN